MPDSWIGVPPLRFVTMLHWTGALCNVPAPEIVQVFPEHEPNVISGGLNVSGEALDPMLIDPAQARAGSSASSAAAFVFIWFLQFDGFVLRIKGRTQMGGKSRRLRDVRNAHILG